LQAAMATLQERPNDALPLTARQVERAKRLGYRRGLAVALHSLGQAKVAVGDTEGAERAFVEAVGVCDRIGMVVDMIGLIANVARVRGQMGRTTEAVELLATVKAEPLSSQRGIMDNVAVAELVPGWLDELRATMEPSEFSSAEERGTARPYEVAAKELIEHAI
ncbi:MAG: hypothetical protein PVJ28_02100, partial [Acidimicrobiia bacterium]